MKFEILQIMSPSEDVKLSNVRGLYLRKYGSWPHDEPFGEEISAKGIPGLVVSFATIFFH